MFNSTFLQTKNNNMNNSTKTTTTSCVLSSQLQQSHKDLAVLETTTSLWRKMTSVFIAIFIVGQVFSQTVTIVTPTGGTALGNTNGSGSDPICRFYGSIRYQVHYTAAELTAAGIPANATISAIAWNVT